MPLVSSPLLYPPTSSPKHPSPRKKRRIDDRKPLEETSANASGWQRPGFLADSSSDEEEETELRRKLPSVLSSPPKQRAEENLEAEDPRGIECGSSESPTATAIENTSSEVESHTEPRLGLGIGKVQVRSCSGKTHSITKRLRRSRTPYEQLVAERSVAAPGCARRAYYGIDIHGLIEEGQNLDREHKAKIEECASAAAEEELVSCSTNTLLWTEKYRAKKFTDLCGDERTHRSVLRWLKSWDSIVYPDVARPKAKKTSAFQDQMNEQSHKKLLLLTGPPGLGKTTLAHVCARQAGYNVMEINASDERSKDVVKGRIKDMVGTNTVRMGTKSQGPAKPVCVVVDEVDGAFGGSAGGDGGFTKALIDLLLLDQRCSSTSGSMKNKKGERFRLMRPIILICNDLYHPSLRPLRQGNYMEVVHVRKPPLNLVVPRMQKIFDKEGILNDSDGVRRLCEAGWGVSNSKEDPSRSGGVNEGDMRELLVLGEWVARKLGGKPTTDPMEARLTKRWIELNLLPDLAQGGSAAKGLGRGNSKDVTERIFLHNAGFPAGNSQTRKASKTVDQAAGHATSGERASINRLREMIESSGEDDRIVTDCFTTYPTRPYQDDTVFTKPTLAHDWIHFHDLISGSVHTQQEWELFPYLSTPIIGLHSLFASAARNRLPTANNFEESTENGTAIHPLSSARAPYMASEMTKASHSTLQHLQSILSLPLQRSFRSASHIAVELLPYLLHMLSPDVKPVVVGGSGEKGIASVRKGSEKEMVKRSVDAMLATGIRFERMKVSFDEQAAGAAAAAAASGGWIYRMDPALDSLGAYETGDGSVGATKARYAVRQVLEQEWRKSTAEQEQAARVRRMKGSLEEDEGEVKAKAEEEERAREAKVLAAKKAVKRDFFGRVIGVVPEAAVEEDDGAARVDSAGDRASKVAKSAARGADAKSAGRIYVSYNEGYSNAVRKGITLKQLMEGM